MPSASRRHARIIALQTLFEVDSTEHAVSEVLTRNLERPILGNAIPDDVPDDLPDEVAEENEQEQLTTEPRRPAADPEVKSFAARLVQGVLAHREELDRIIVRSAPNWPIDQMSGIDKAILRLAIYEILFDNKVPLKAAINEAVELGKRFGSDSSSRFINGVLGTVAQEQQSRGSRGETGNTGTDKETKAN